MGRRKSFIGTVKSAKMQKTCIVLVKHLAKHPAYGKVVKRSNKFKVHDEKGIAGVDDLVRIEETRPISRDKHFRLVEVVRKAPSRSEIKDEIK